MALIKTIMRSQLLRSLQTYCTASPQAQLMFDEEKRCVATTDAKGGQEVESSANKAEIGFRIKWRRVILIPVHARVYVARNIEFWRPRVYLALSLSTQKRSKLHVDRPLN